ncbi:hypothetical protein [Sodalis-like endosymbiont of Proechinophthirus fluctus]|uniref:hypothetical protein n=1 Tax=Sodalis-like endosymbiont of Proechinophthirus fluctus TaxID=1462730 RepID=UPI000AB02AA2|nr:hypothetical protein [Sodalis-like endosymbiont of Proechinophthirus fluctus]
MCLVDSRYVLEIGRYDIPRKENIYSWVEPTRPVPTERVYEVDSRMDFKGHEMATLCEA